MCCLEILFRKCLFGIKRWFSYRFSYKRGHTQISTGFLAEVGAHTDKRWFSFRFSYKWGGGGGGTQISAGFLTGLPISGAHTDKRWFSYMLAHKWGTHR